MFNSDYFNVMNPNDKALIYQRFWGQPYNNDRSNAILGIYARQLLKQTYPEVYQNTQNYLNQINRY